MLKMVKFGGLTVGAGAVIGFSVVAWLYTHRLDNPSVASGNLTAPIIKTAPSLASNFSGATTPTPGLDVVTDGSQGSVLGDSSGSAAHPTPTPVTFPGPSGFHVYDQYLHGDSAMYIDVQQGTGAAIASGSKVTVNYRGYLTDGTEFDETYSTGKTFAFTEGAGNVIPGWENSIFGMKVGGQRRLIIPPSQGYGATAQGSIPANSVLVFDVELVSVQ